MLFELLRNLREKWSNWCGDREMELAIRSHLTNQGYFGRTAALRRVKLVAVERPGWVQVYRFEVTARLAPRPAAGTFVDDDDPDDPDDRPVYHELFGLVKEDARRGRPAIRVFRSGESRRELFDQWSDGLLQLRSRRGLDA